MQRVGTDLIVQGAGEVYCDVGEVNTGGPYMRSLSVHARLSSCEPQAYRVASHETWLGLVLLSRVKLLQQVGGDLLL